MEKFVVDLIGVGLAVLIFQTLAINDKLEKCVGLLGDCVNALEDINGKTPDEQSD
jgi:hypothetical protein